MARLDVLTIQRLHVDKRSLERVSAGIVALSTETDSCNHAIAKTYLRNHV